MSERRVGVYICHCGGNISDYVDVECVRREIERELGVTVAKTTMFTCSDASQNEMIEDIRESGLDGMVVASCSPKLHLGTFRAVAERAGLNPYQYVQVNIREQCSWPHSDDRGGATSKAIGLVKGGIEKVIRSEPLEPIRVTSVKKVLVIGGGVAGLRAALEMADLGVEVFLVERARELGGAIAGLGAVYPSGRRGIEIVGELVGEIRKRENITIWTNAEITDREGYIGNFEVTIETDANGSGAPAGDVQGQARERISLTVGAIITATGFDDYIPGKGEYSYGEEGVVTLPEFERILNGDRAADDAPAHDMRDIRSVAFVYCVGSRQGKEVEDPNTYCSRYCCNAAVHAALEAQKRHPGLRAYHVYRDLRTYGKFELLYEQASRAGSLFLRFEKSAPPVVAREGAAGGSGSVLDTPEGNDTPEKQRAAGRKRAAKRSGAARRGLSVRVKDLLTGGEEIEIPVDLVVLVTGMVPQENARLTELLKLPIGSDGFYNEIHPKLRPVETVIDGVYIGGCCQGPKNLSESITSSLSAVSKAASLLVKGYVDLQPFIAYVIEDRCSWCGECANACPYSAIEKIVVSGREIASIRDVLCKGCGACIPVCPRDATQLKGYTDDQIESMISAFAEVAADV